MYRLSSIIGILFFASGLLAQSPHGEDFKMNCAACHSNDSWEIPSEVWNYDEPLSPKELANLTISIPPDSIRFNHNETAFPLDGGHAATDCRLCHDALVFEATSSECISCHTDIHNMTVGSDCARCHTVDNWLVDNVTELHQDEGFPLLGAHAIINCNDCHISDSDLQFTRLGNECINCHMGDYLATTEPNHIELGYSTVCNDCHDVNSFEWSAENILHDFFPLVQGHDIGCVECHTTGIFDAISSDCFSCHQDDYNATQNPNHIALNFGTDCASCHTLEPGWMPAQYAHDDFPIYSGNHAGEWNECSECHTTPGNYSLFSCIDCHEHNDPNDLAGEHDDVNDYQYESNACYQCHPNGD